MNAMAGEMTTKSKQLLTNQSVLRICRIWPGKWIACV